MSQWTQDDVNRHNAKLGAKMPAHVPAPQRSKYKNVKTVVNGERFDSRRESDYWLLLKAREQLGEITELRRQVSFPLYAPELVNDRPTGAIVQISEYRADYVFLENGVRRVLDAKGKRTKEYLRSKKWLELQQNTIIEEV